MFKKIKNTTSSIRTRIGDISPKVGIVLGSGLGQLAERIIDPIYLPYDQIEGFPQSTVQGHAGRFVFGKLGGVEVVCMQGRFHFYEGYKIEDTVIGVRVMGLLGIEVLIVSNAAGGVGEGFKVGDVMIICDHINMLPNPLIGKNEDHWGTRFPTMNNAYDKKLIELAHHCAKQTDMKLTEGVYLASSGPSYETVAEYKFFKIIGAHACGMSTVPEVIVAKHMGIKVLGFSVITNAPFDVTPYTDHDEVQMVANTAAKKMGSLIEKIVSSCL